MIRRAYDELLALVWDLIGIAVTNVAYYTVRALEWASGNR